MFTLCPLILKYKYTIEDKHGPIVQQLSLNYTQYNKFTSQIEINNLITEYKLNSIHFLALKQKNPYQNSTLL